MEDYKKKYEQALERARKINNGDGVAAPPDYTICETIFPELKESRDERIRKECISIIDAWNKSCRLQGDYCEVAPECIAWLEKQGEQKPTDKVEQEEDVELTDFESVLFSAFSDAWQEYLSGKEVNVAKWAREHSAELLEVARKPNFCHHEVDFSGCSEEYRKAYYDGWNNCNQQHAQLEAEQKPTWSEEDEYILETLFIRLNNEQENYPQQSCDFQEIEEIKNWLKTIKERMKGE